MDRRAPVLADRERRVGREREVEARALAQALEEPHGRARSAESFHRALGELTDRQAPLWPESAVSRARLVLFWKDV